ncbi:MAG: hypothetical protein QNK68_02250 [Flavobacteriales bacterium]
MTKKEITFRDPVIESVVNKFVSRSDVGFKKYGVTLDEDPGDLNVWMTHLQEELMDAVNYIEKLKQVTTEVLQDALVKKHENNA